MYMNMYMYLRFKRIKISSAVLFVTGPKITLKSRIRSMLKYHF